MSYKFPKVKKNAEGLFGPTANNQFYSAASYHNATAAYKKDKTRWRLKQGEQFEAFKASDENKWQCLSNGGNFSILDNGNVVMGENEERISFFPSPVNPGDNWHGYPVNSAKYIVSDELIEKWVIEKVIDNRIQIKLLKGQL